MSVELREISSPDAWPRDGYRGSFDPQVIAAHGADAHAVVTEAGNVIAHASVWAGHMPGDAVARTGVIGHYGASSDAGSKSVLDWASRRLSRMDMLRAVGPMDGTTWRSYRFVTDAGEEPPFFLEPTNPPEYPEWWRNAGFAPLAGYSSTRTDDLAYRDPRLDRVADRLGELGVTVRPLSMDRYEEELARIHALSSLSFARNFHYVPISRDEFISMYRPLRPYVRPEMALLAEVGPEIVGYAFAIPDLRQAQRGETVDTMILKTLAVSPERRYAGLGGLLLWRAHDSGRSLGYNRAIHALMHDSNNSRNLSGVYARTIRRYTLFTRPLVAE